LGLSGLLGLDGNSLHLVGMFALLGCGGLQGLGLDDDCRNEHLFELGFGLASHVEVLGGNSLVSSEDSGKGD